LDNLTPIDLRYLEIRDYPTPIHLRYLEIRDYPTPINLRYLEIRIMQQLVNGIKRTEMSMSETHSPSV
jgi:hypothetical protein